ncbi:MAG: hypothetical protein ABIJ34_09070 [archaeon]
MKEITELLQNRLQTVYDSAKKELGALNPTSTDDKLLDWAWQRFSHNHIFLKVEDVIFAGVSQLIIRIDGRYVGKTIDSLYGPHSGFYVAGLPYDNETQESIKILKGIVSNYPGIIFPEVELFGYQVISNRVELIDGGSIVMTMTDFGNLYEVSGNTLSRFPDAADLYKKIRKELLEMHKGTNQKYGLKVINNHEGDATKGVSRIFSLNQNGQLVVSDLDHIIIYEK